MRLSALLLFLLLALTVTATVEAMRQPASGKQPAAAFAPPSG